MFNVLLGPLNSTIVNSKRRPTTTSERVTRVATFREER